jgi:hypothetical protein
LSLAPPSPDPANDAITLHFELPQAARVRLVLFDGTGRRMAEILDEDVAAGPHDHTFALRDKWGRRLAAGFYRVRLEAGDRVITRGFATVR